MSESESVLQHHHHTLDTQLVQLSSASGEFYDGLQGLDFARGVFQGILTGKLVRSSLLNPNKYPTYAHRLYSEIFDGIRKLEDVDEISGALNLVSDIILPATGVTISASRLATPVRLIDKYNGICPDAEKYFSQALLAADGKDANRQYKLSVYFDRHGVPLLLEKYVASKNAMALRPFIVIHGKDGESLNNDGAIQVPAGTIVSVGDNIGRETAVKRAGNGVIMSTIQVGGILSLNPQRLSPWAHELMADKQLFALGYEGPFTDPLVYSPERAALFQATSVMDFQLAAEKVMAFCGI